MFSLLKKMRAAKAEKARKAAALAAHQSAQQTWDSARAAVEKAKQRKTTQVQNVALAAAYDAAHAKLRLELGR